MGVERQNGVDLQFESVDVIDQVHLAADRKGLLLCSRARGALSELGSARSHEVLAAALPAL